MEDPLRYHPNKLFAKKHRPIKPPTHRLLEILEHEPLRYHMIDYMQKAEEKSFLTAGGSEFYLSIWRARKAINLSVKIPVNGGDDDDGGNEEKRTQVVRTTTSALLTGVRGWMQSLLPSLASVSSSAAKPPPAAATAGPVQPVPPVIKKEEAALDMTKDVEQEKVAKASIVVARLINRRCGVQLEELSLQTNLAIKVLLKILADRNYNNFHALIIDSTSCNLSRQGW